MAAAVHAPQMGVMGQHPHAIQQQQYEYQNAYSVMEDSDDGHSQDIMDEDMEAYYRQHEYEQHVHQQQMLAQQNGMQYHHDDGDAEMDDGDMYDSDSSDESVLPDENIDFGLIYARHTFLATVEGQASVVKGDSLLLLDDANSYWWLVRVLKTEDVGYIPAENVETPYERLARLNKHRNIDIAAATDREKADADAKEQKRRAADGKLKSLIGWPRRGSTQPPAADPYDDDPETREGRRVIFGPSTFVDHPGVTWSSDEDDSDEDEEHDGGVEDDDHDVNMDQHINEQLGYDAEPDDGIEWAQDAVEAMRDANVSSGTIDPRDSDMAPDAHPHQTEQSGNRQLATAAGGAAVAGAAGLLAVNASGSSASAVPEPSPDLAESIPGAFPPAPAGSPSPSSSPVHGLAARALPTPPPHRAPPISPSHDASPEPFAREMTPVTPPAPSSSTVPTVTTPASSDLHGEDARRGHQPSASVASAVSAFSTTSGETPNHTPLRSSVQSEASSYSTPPSAGVLAAGAGGAVAAGVAAAGAAAHISTNPTSPAPMSPTGTTPASPASAGPPVGFVRSTDAAKRQAPQEPAPAPVTKPRVPVAPLWYSDAFDISRLSTLVRARATDIKRNTPVPRPRRSTEPADAVQRMLYGDRPEVEHMPPDLRAPFVHLQAKMDAFDREIDDLLGSLVAVY
ncbi:hypothetical protein CC85DRAFT_283871 [Cutaneotrichosporon oleaginosum]|uniref:SH3 domain-containing protein n=1 Tax=Cutaneotrichosporon oleaginosum TaxID=879819 RepID=A0A0J0XSQ0_9TREE|nr:uncharacterized protein CC85DRAFT_283871 [Cutaneotrichosporon oleaginosum]KLT44097.1 hypothetical protein CC85DRAFT_283871 [Cutaneotrichosporon oleaginosum]TXT09448.1 hypothetical protein COLE_03382 [Cutaneotrichosporon oleaginosum]